MPDSPRILVIEDEADIRELLRFNLERENFRVEEAEDGPTGLELARKHKPDLILLDVMLPGMDGFTVCKELEKDRVTVGIPIIMLTARGETIDRILGLELGADDYVVKPFHVRELLLRIRAILRRQQSASTDSPVLEHNGILLNAEAHTATLEGTPLDLTATEFRLLTELLSHKGRVHTREALLASVWGYQFEGYARTVDTHVRRLRAKLGRAADVIETIRGVGYRVKE